MTVLQSFPPELCSLICQDPILERLDLKSISFISHAFRNEARRELSYRFPFLRGASRVRSWCLSLQSRPHLAIHIKGLVLLLSQPLAPGGLGVLHLIRALHMCVNLKELEVLHQKCRRRQPTYSSATHILSHDQPFKFKLTKFVNSYFRQDNAEFEAFLSSQRKLESLELHSGEMNVPYIVFPYHELKTLSCSPKFFGYRTTSATRVRLDFENSTYEYELRRVLSRNLTRDMKSLAIFLNQSQSHFPEIIRVINASSMYIQHLEIHQFLPSQIEKELPLPVNPYGRSVGTLVFRPPPGLPEKAFGNPNLCAYVELRTPIGRRKVAEKLFTRTFLALTRLVLIVHGNDYEFRRNLYTGVLTGEILITRDTREWALVK